MSEVGKKRGLGRGLDALFETTDEEDATPPGAAENAAEISDDIYQQEDGYAGNGVQNIPEILDRLQDHSDKEQDTENDNAIISDRKNLNSVDQKNQEPSLGAMQMDIASIVPNKDQPRQIFDEEALRDLAESIEQHGVLQPLIVRPVIEEDTHAENVDIDNIQYEIVAGERRWRASQLAGLHTVPAIIKPLDDHEVLEVAIIENLQRENLTAIEEAEAIHHLVDKFKYTQEEAARTIGKSRPYVSNLLRLLSLPESVREMVNENKITQGHARALIGSDDAEKIAKIVYDQGLSVREVEKIASGKTANKAQKTDSTKIVKPKGVQELEAIVSEEIGLKIVIDINENLKGKLTIYYDDMDQLNNIVDRLR